MKNALVISGKVYVAWKRKMLHDVTLHDVTGGHQAYIHRKKKIYLWRIEFCIWLRPRAVYVMHARRDYKLASREKSPLIKGI